MNPTLFLCREMPDITTVWKVVWEKTPFQPAIQSVYCISENETPNKDIICVNIDNMLVTLLS
jgi:hypothetical protein